MYYWPHLELSEYEKRFVAAYQTKDKPGVLRRTYNVPLNNTAQPTIPGLQNISLQGQVQISRASRVFALTFTGDINAWRLKISTASGTEFTPRFPNGVYPMQLPMIIEPSWELDPNESLIFEGQPIVETALILEISVHVWEFPGMIRGMDKMEPENPRMGAGPSLPNRSPC